MTVSPGYYLPYHQYESLSVQQLAERKGLRPIESEEDLACDGAFTTDHELDEFLAHLAASRHSELA